MALEPRKFTIYLSSCKRIWIPHIKCPEFREMAFSTLAKMMAAALSSRRFSDDTLSLPASPFWRVTLREHNIIWDYSTVTGTTCWWTAWLCLSVSRVVDGWLATVVYIMFFLVYTVYSFCIVVRAGISHDPSLSPLPSLPSGVGMDLLASPVFSVWQMVDSLFLYPLPLRSRLGPEDRPAPPSGQRVPATVRRSSGGSVGSQPRRPWGLRQGGRLWFGLHPAGPRPQTARPQPAGHPGHETLAAVPLVAQPAALRLQHPVAVEYLLPGGERAGRWGRCGGSGRNK